jgi:hypothetical protein
MIVKAHYGAWDVTCSRCEQVKQVPAGSFQQCVATIKAAGWKIVKTKDGWEHHCPECKVNRTKPEEGYSEPEPEEADAAANERDIPARRPGPRIPPKDERARIIYRLFVGHQSSVWAMALEYLEEEELASLEETIEAERRRREVLSAESVL